MKSLFKYVLASAVALVLAGQGLVRAQEATPAVYPPAPNLPVFRQEELDQMLAPIALYPDALLAQTLMAATYPLEVVEAARWVKQNPGLTGPQLEAAVQGQPWDPSVKSLTAFPSVLAMLDQDLQWTQRLGDAFLAQRQQVMDTVQELRRRAYAAGTLATTPQQRVVVEPQYIYVEPAYADVVYVPMYDPWIVYGAWWWPAYPPVYFAPPGGAVFVAGFFWGYHFAVHHALWGQCDWRHRDVTIVVNNYNYFSRTQIVSTHWEHDGHHRRGVPYRAPALEQRYGRIGNTHTAGQPVPRHAEMNSTPQPVRHSERGAPKPDVQLGRPVSGAAAGTASERSDHGHGGIRPEPRQPDGQSNPLPPSLGAPPGGRNDRGHGSNRNEADLREGTRTVTYQPHSEAVRGRPQYNSGPVNGVSSVDPVIVPPRSGGRGNISGDVNNGDRWNRSDRGVPHGQRRGQGSDREAAKTSEKKSG